MGVNLSPSRARTRRKTTGPLEKGAATCLHSSGHCQTGTVVLTLRRRLNTLLPSSAATRGTRSGSLVFPANHNRSIRLAKRMGYFYRCAARALGLALLLLLAAPAVAANWTDQRHLGPLVCRADFPLDGYDGLFQDLVSLQQELQRTLAVAPAREPVELYLFRDKDSYVEYLHSHLPGVPFRRALYVKAAGPGRVYVYRSEDLPVDLRHESTHALLHAALPAVPLWIDEGLAEYFEVPAAQRAFDNPHLNLLFKAEVQFGRVPSLSVLESRRDLSEMTATDYRNAWAWVHFMFHGPKDAHAELVRFLAESAAGRTPQPLSVVLPQKLPDLDQQFLQHFRNWQRKQSKGRSAVPSPQRGQATLPATMPAAPAKSGMLLTRGGASL